MRQHSGGVAAGVELMRRLAAYRDLLRLLDNGFDALERDAAEAADENAAQAEALGAHGRAVGQGEDVVRRHVERFVVGEAQADGALAGEPAPPVTQPIADAASFQ